MATVAKDFQVSYKKFILIEIMLFELTGTPEDKEYNVFEIQAFFNSVQSKRFFLIFRP